MLLCFGLVFFFIIIIIMLAGKRNSFTDVGNTVRRVIKQNVENCCIAQKKWNWQLFPWHYSSSRIIFQIWLFERFVFIVQLFKTNYTHKKIFKCYILKKCHAQFKRELCNLTYQQGKPCWELQRKKLAVLLWRLAWLSPKAEYETLEKIGWCYRNCKTIQEL